MTEVYVERGTLDDGVAMVFRDYGHRVRMIFDPARIIEAVALTLLSTYIPRLADAMNIIHLAGK